MKKYITTTLLVCGHILVWLIPILAIESSEGPLYIGIFSSNQFDCFYPIYYGTLINVFFFYCSVYLILPLLLKQFNLKQSLVGILLFYFLVSLFEAGIDKAVVLHESLYPEGMSFLNILLVNLLINALFLLMIVGYFSIQRLIINERNKKKLREEKLQMELDFLRSQINPHFIFNTLNNLFATAKKNHDDETANGIAKLSGLMRYMLYETNTSEILLTKEVDYLENYIKLQQMRFRPEDDIKVSFTINGDISQQRITPMLLIPFVENAFKFGISLKQHSFVNITLSNSSEQMTFEVENSINHHNNSGNHSGVGLKNVERRLNLIYPEKHNLTITSDANTFKTQLTLKHEYDTVYYR